MSTLDPKTADSLVEHGGDLLKIFHQEYERDPVSTATEFRRGKVTEWRQMLNLLYGESVTETIVMRARAEVKLTVPHAGPLTEDGKGYYGFDSGSDM